MKTFPLVPRKLLFRSLLPLMFGGLAMVLAGCGEADGDVGSGTPSSKKADGLFKGITVEGEGFALEATTAPAILRGYSTQPLSVRIVGGWIDREKIERANMETDEAEKKKKAMGSFGTFTLQLAAGKAEPGDYQLVPDGKDPQSGTVILGKAKKLGLVDVYTSQSGTLTIQSVTMKGENGRETVSAVAGTFDGQFSSDSGDSRAFSGRFGYAPKAKK